MSTVTTVNIRCDRCGKDRGHTEQRYNSPTRIARKEVANLGWTRVFDETRRRWLDICDGHKPERTAAM